MFIIILSVDLCSSQYLYDGSSFYLYLAFRRDDVPCRAVRRKAGRQWRQLEENSNSTVAMKDIITMKYADLFVKSSVY
jgi:hypothetical protein